MTFAELKTLVGDLTNDPNSERYTPSQRATELDNSQESWNVEIGLIKDTVPITVVEGTRQYALSGLTGTPIRFTRVTHKGLLLNQRDKGYFDMYFGGSDWTTTTGTPTDFFAEVTDPDNQFLTVAPTPTGNDIGANLIAEYIKRHTSMSSDSDTPFMSGTTANSLLRPFDWGLAYEASARLLARDPSEVNVPKSGNYAAIARGVKQNVIQVFKAFEKSNPLRLQGGRRW